MMFSRLKLILMAFCCMALSACVTHVPPQEILPRPDENELIRQRGMQYSSVLKAGFEKYSGNIDDAVKAFEDLMVRYPDEPDIPFAYSSFLLDLSFRLRAQDQIIQSRQKTIEILENSLKRFPDNVKLRSFLVDVFFLTEQLSKARENLEYLVGQNPDNANMTFQLVRLYNEMGQPQTALALMTSIPEDLRGDKEYGKLLALSYAEAGQFIESEKLYRDYLEKSPLDYEARFNYALILLNMSRLDESLDAFRVLLGEYPNMSEIRIQIAEILRRKDDLDGALQILQDQELPSFELRFNIAKIYLLKGDYKAAERLFKLMIQEDPGNSLLLYYTAVTQYEDDRPQDALVTLRAFIDREDTNYPILELVVQIFIDQGRIVDAVRMVDRKIRLYPEDCSLYNLLVRIYTSTNHSEKAAEVFETGYSRCRADIRFIINYGLFLELNGNWKKAVRITRDLLPDQPDNPELNNFVGYTLADHDQELDYALELIRKALEKSPDQAAYLDSMGWVLFKKGEYEPALEYLLRAVRLDPSDALIFDHLAQVYLKLARPSDALEMFREAARRDPQYNEKLQSLENELKPVSDDAPPPESQTH